MLLQCLKYKTLCYFLDVLLATAKCRENAFTTISSLKTTTQITEYRPTSFPLSGLKSRTHTCDVVDGIEANSESSDLQRVVLLPAAGDLLNAMPVLGGEHCVVVHVESRPWRQSTAGVRRSETQLLCATCQLQLFSQ